MEKVFVKKGHCNRLYAGHLWVFSNELQDVPKLEAGELVEVMYQNYSYGYAFYNPNSLISCRLLNTKDENIESLLMDRIKSAYQLRLRLLPNSKIFRLVFGESDILSGLVIDKFEDYLVIQILSYGYEKRKNILVDVLLKLFPDTKGILAKSNSKLRDIEGLPDRDEVLFGEIAEELLTVDEGIKISINLSGGQKTGYFLDQRINRTFLRKISKNKTVLDCYCNSGGFGLNALMGGAAKVTFLDSSESALLNAKKNLELNNYDNYELLAGDAFELLPNLIDSGNTFDIVVLDPPAFAKNKKTSATAASGYSKLNRLGIKLLKDDGFLLTSSCSHFIDDETFYDLVVNEVAKSGRTARLVHSAFQSPDHPVFFSMPETKYLKFLVFHIS